ncbi:MAG TPA: 30S ribosomal protein S8e [Candidatus Lokiarchaeia archaeon]|nr:30S ribosomal protein S8e [Candidatus Lokiarchaeia archaeon]
MPAWHRTIKQKPSGGRKRPNQKKHRREAGRYPIETRMGERSIKHQRVRGGNQKVKLYFDEYINVTDGATTTRVKIQDVLENPSNKDYNRRKIITRNTLVKTELGNVRVSSRPGQTPVINGNLVKE